MHSADMAGRTVLSMLSMHREKVQLRCQLLELEPHHLHFGRVPLAAH